MKKQFLISALACQFILGQLALTGFAQLPPSRPPGQRRPLQPEPQQPPRPSEEETVKITTPG